MDMGLAGRRRADVWGGGDGLITSARPLVRPTPRSAMFFPLVVLVAVLPGRHPVLVAKQLASLAAVAPKRVLPVFGLRSAIPAEREVFTVPDGERAAVFDESLRVLRAALVDESASYTGRFFTVTAAAVMPRPTPPLDIWLGGSAPAAFRRIGTLADGWLGSFLTPGEAGAGRKAIERGAVGLLTKPIDFALLRLEIDNRLGQAA